MAPAPPQELLPQGSLSLEAWQYSDVAMLYRESVGHRTEDETLNVTGFPSFGSFAARVGTCLQHQSEPAGLQAPNPSMVADIASPAAFLSLCAVPLLRPQPLCLSRGRAARRHGQQPPGQGLLCHGPGGRGRAGEQLGADAGLAGGLGILARPADLASPPWGIALPNLTDMNNVARDYMRAPHADAAPRRVAILPVYLSSFKAPRSLQYRAAAG